MVGLSTPPADLRDRAPKMLTKDVLVSKIADRAMRRYGQAFGKALLNDLIKDGLMPAAHTAGQAEQHARELIEGYRLLLTTHRRGRILQVALSIFLSPRRGMRPHWRTRLQLFALHFQPLR